MKKTILYSSTALLLLLFILFFLLTCLKSNPSDLRINNSQSNIIDQHESDLTQLQTSSSWNLILVNSNSPLPPDFSVKLTELRNGHSIDERAYPDLQAMMDAARAEGLHPFICSSYRTVTKQEELYENKVSYYLSQGYSQEDSETEAAKCVAKLGTSEHHTGLAENFWGEKNPSDLIQEGYIQK